MKNSTLVIALLLMPFIGSAWNGVGHSTGGAIAYYYLKQNNPAIVSKVVNVLKQHPWFSSKWQTQLAGLTAEEKNIKLFMLASTYPDDAKTTTEGGIKKKWHYIDYPFVPQGQTVTPIQPQSPNAEEKIIELLTSIKNELTPAEKAKKVCWLFHLIEDVHQPLHSASLFDASHPVGDEGGNGTFIKFNTGGPVKLHSYWDGLIKSGNVPNTAKALFNNPLYATGQLTELQQHPNVHDWIQTESFSIAKQSAYKNGAINGTTAQPTTVDATYSSGSLKIAERRIVLAGIRLGKSLVTIFQ